MARAEQVGEKMGGEGFVDVGSAKHLHLGLVRCLVACLTCQLECAGMTDAVCHDRVIALNKLACSL